MFLVINNIFIDSEVLVMMSLILKFVGLVIKNAYRDSSHEKYKKMEIVTS